MRKFRQWVAFLLALIVILISSCLFVGARRQIPDRLAILHLSDCRLPCWIGIVPNRSSLSSALYAIESMYKGYTIVHRFKRHGFPVVDIGTPEHSLLSVKLSVDETTPAQTVYQVMLENNATMGKVTFGDIVLLLGPPNSVNPSPPNSNINPYMTYVDYEVRVGFGLTFGFDSECGTIPKELEIAGIVIGNLSTLRPSSLPDQPWTGFHACY